MQWWPGGWSWALKAPALITALFSRATPQFSDDKSESNLWEINCCVGRPRPPSRRPGCLYIFHRQLSVLTSSLWSNWFSITVNHITISQRAPSYIHLPRGQLKFHQLVGWLPQGRPTKLNVWRNKPALGRQKINRWLYIKGFRKHWNFTNPFSW